MDAMLRRKKKLETEIGNLAKIIAQDDFSPALRKALTDRENEVASITEKVLAAKPDSICQHINRMSVIARAKLKDLRTLLASGPIAARAGLLQHVGSPSRIKALGKGGRYRPLPRAAARVFLLVLIFVLKETDCPFSETNSLSTPAIAHVSFLSP